ncbi:MAG TPA: hypothetical protein VFO77_05515, partial [Actinoplanes sp.]|nr:hypothetical protein [Actinoplanes sp.]
MSEAAAKQPGTNGPPEGRDWVPVAVGVAAAIIVAVAELVKEQASNSWLVLLAALAAIAVQLTLQAQLATPERRNRFDEIMRRGREAVAALPLAPLIFVVITVVIAVATLLVTRATAEAACPHPTELRILTSPEGLQSIREVTQAYARATADDGCPAVFPYVYAAGTPAVSGALARGWVDTRTEHPLVDFGPRPDVWLPDSTVDVRRVRDILARTTPRAPTANGRLPAPLRSVTSIASSPIVLAGPSTASDDAVTLPGLVGAVLKQRRPALAAANPESSVAGLLAAAGYLLDERTGLVDPVEARRREQIIADTTPSRSDEVSLLCAHLRQGQTRTAVLTSLRTWRRMVAGKVMGAGCSASPRLPPGVGTAPTAVVEGPALDLPFVRFTWTGTRQARAADDLLTWLLGDSARPQLSQAGLDPPLP